MASQPLAFAELLAGGVLVTAALTGDTIKDVVTGKAGPFKGFGTSAAAASSPTDAGAGAAANLKGEKGQLVGRPKDRPGVPTKPEILDFVSRISGIIGKPVQLGTGTAHSQYTTSGNVSNHWDGNAIDLPAYGALNYAIGRAALVVAGMNPLKAASAQGGIHNVNGWQIIFMTHDGGDHTNHVHVGRTA